MITEFKRIGIVTRPETPQIEETLHTLAAFLLSQGLEVFIDRESVSGGVVREDDLARCRVTDKDNIGRECSLVIVLGGDGTFLSAARKVAPFRIPSSASTRGIWGSSPKCRAKIWSPKSPACSPANTTPKNASCWKPT